MKKSFLNSHAALVVLITGMFLSMPAFAEKPAWAGKDGDKHSRNGEYESNHDRSDDRDDHEKQVEYESEHRSNSDTNVHVDVYFGDQDRVVVHDYYEERYNKGRCPPGLAKKHNGCMPPGQARKWQKGRPLPREIIYHDLPPRVIIQLGKPPAGHKYVRVAADILLIAVGTGMVVDAIEDLGRI
jgi:Ni/Co efflux regulator RcnB